MKIVVCPADLSGCGYYRMIVPYLALAKHYGHKVSFADRPNKTSRVASLSPSAIPLVRLKSVFEKADVIVLQRQTNPEILPFIDHAHSIGAKIIMEFDDNFHVLPKSNPNSSVYGTGKIATTTMETFVRRADHCIVSTPSLAEEYTRLNPKISVCYNAVDDNQFARLSPTEITGEPKRDGQIRIGYAGSVTHEGDFQTMSRPLIKIMRANPKIRFVFIGHDMRLMMPNDIISRCEFGGRTSTEGVSVDDFGDHSKLASVMYYELIKKADLDLQIAPLATVTFNKSKSFLKLIEAGMLGIPALCTRFGPYRQYIDEAPAGPPVVGSCTDEREWQRMLEYFIESEMFRREVALANLEYVRKNHLISKRAHQWQTAVKSTWSSDEPILGKIYQHLGIA